MVAIEFRRIDIGIADGSGRHRHVLGPRHANVAITQRKRLGKDARLPLHIIAHRLIRQSHRVCQAHQIADLRTCHGHRRCQLTIEHTRFQTPLAPQNFKFLIPFDQADFLAIAQQNSLMDDQIAFIGQPLCLQSTEAIECLWRIERHHKFRIGPQSALFDPRLLTEQDNG